MTASIPEPTPRVSELRNPDIVVDDETRRLREDSRPLLVLDDDGRILLCSRALEERLGLEPGAWVGAALEEHVEVRDLVPEPGGGTRPALLSLGSGERVRAGARADVHESAGRQILVLYIDLEPTEPTPTRAATSPAATTVLVVDDEPSVRRLAVRCLAGAGYHVLQAGGPAEAVRVAAEHQGPIHLMVTDVRMPGMSGVELSEHMTSQRPGLRTLFMSGYATGTLDPCGALEAGSCLAKPFSPQQLVRSVEAALGDSDERLPD